MEWAWPGQDPVGLATQDPCSEEASFKENPQTHGRGGMKRDVASGLGGEASVLAEVRYIPVRILLVADGEFAKRRWLCRTLCSPFHPQSPLARPRCGQCPLVVGEG